MASVKRIKASSGTGNASVATVQTIRAALATTLTVDTVVGIYAGTEGFYATMGTPHTFTDPITSEIITVISDATAVDFQGHIDTGHIIIDAIAPGYTDLGSKVGDIVIIRPTTQWTNNVSDTLAVSLNDDGTIKSPEGQLFNGKIVPSVASSNLTLAIKTLAGADPSTTDVVYIRIGGTVRSITAPLSVTLAAGTNWFSKGNGTVANYFAYIGYNATDGIVLGVSNSSRGTKYGDFSTTNTDFNYAKISTTTNAAATDVYENIGVFNAILGVTATFLWTLPAAASAIVITQPSRSDDLQYSTSEIDTGQKWVDGRPIYRKTLRGTFTMAATSNLIAHGISGMTASLEILRISGGVKLAQPLAGGQTQGLYYRESGGNWFTLAGVDATNVTISSSFAWGSSWYTIILEYVK